MERLSGNQAEIGFPELSAVWAYIPIRAVSIAFRDLK
jgi:hypothetical protein